MPWSLPRKLKKTENQKHALVTPKHPLPLLGLTTHGKPHCFCTLQKRDWSNVNHKKYVVLSNKKFVITCRKTPRLPACLPRSGLTSQLEGPPPAKIHYCNKYFHSPCKDANCNKYFYVLSLLYFVYVYMIATDVIFVIFTSLNRFHVSWITWEIIWVFGVDEKKGGLEICLFSNIKTLLAHA